MAEIKKEEWENVLLIKSQAYKVFPVYMYIFFISCEFV